MNRYVGTSRKKLRELESGTMMISSGTPHEWLAVGREESMLPTVWPLQCGDDIYILELGTPYY